MTAPRISVILCVHGDRGGLRATLASVLDQADVDLELLVVDDASPDDTPRTLADVAARDDRVRVLTHGTNRRLTASINHGLAEARGSWIARIDEGDTWAPGKLAAQWSRIEADPELVLVGARCTYRDPGSGAALRVPRLPTDDAGLRRDFVRGLNPVISSAALFKRFPRLRYNEAPQLGLGVSDPISDYEHWLRLSFLGRLANLPDPLVDFAYGPSYDGITSRRAGAQFELKRRIHAGFVRLLRARDLGAARAAVADGFSLGADAPGRFGLRRDASMRLRYAASYRGQPWRSLLRAAGYALDPADLAYHLRTKAGLARALEGRDWCGWVDPTPFAQPSAAS